MLICCRSSLSNARTRRRMQNISLRTRKYFEAMQRDGPLFDYKKWLREVQEEEKSVKRPAALPLSQPMQRSASYSGESAVISVFASGEPRDSPHQSKSGGRE